MRSLTVFCSRDLEDRVVSAFEHAGIEAFLRLGGATGHRFVPTDEMSRTMTWEAIMFVVPVASTERIDTAVDELEHYAGTCEIEPCLRVIVGTVDRAY